MYGNGVIQNLVKAMLKSGLVGEVLALVRGLDDYDVVPCFITNEEQADRIVLTSYYPSALARLLKDYGDYGSKIGMVVRSCDARAIIELAKREQVNLDNTYMIGVECYGTVKIDMKTKGLYVFPDSDAELRPSCRRCEYPVPTMADISCRLDQDSAFITVNTKKGEEITSLVEVPAKKIDRDIEAVKRRAVDSQQKDFGELRAMSLSERMNYWLGQFDKCIKCYGCRNVCPICYCQDCYLNADRLFVKRGEVPPEKMFHLVRLSHVADSCLNCGQCDAVCPVEIPISKLYHMLNKELGAVFNYESGMDVNAPPPLVFITDEEMRMEGVSLD